MTPIGSIHAECAAGYFGTRDTVLRRIQLTTPDLDEGDLAEIGNELAKESRPAPLASTTPEEARATDSGAGGMDVPGLAKARPLQEPSADGEEDTRRRDLG